MTETLHQDYGEGTYMEHCSVDRVVDRQRFLSTFQAVSNANEGLKFIFNFKRL